MQKGDKHHGKSFEDFLTGSYIKELDPKTGVETNAEIEKEEFLMFPDGVVQKAIGDRHTKGGIGVHIPDGTKIVSNDLKFTKDQAKSFKDKYGVGVTTSDTYAKGIEKALSSTGYRKLEQEEVDIMKEIEKTKESKSIDSNTAGMNLEFLTGKLNDIVAKKKELEPQKKEIFDVVFNKQESRKKMEGGYDNKEGFKQGGISNQNIKKLAAKYNITEDQVKGLISYKKGGRVPTYDNGDVHGDDKVKTEKTLEENLGVIKRGIGSDSVPYGEKDKNSSQSKQRLNDMLTHYGLDKLGDSESVNDAASRLQKHIIKNDPNLVEHYMLNVANPTNKMRDLAGNDKLDKEGLKALKEADPEKFKKVLEDGFNDGLWWYRMPYKKELELPQDQYDKIVADENVKFEEVDGEKYIVKPDGEYLKLIPTAGAAPEDIKIAKDNEDIVFRGIRKEDPVGFQRYVHPSQYVGYPSSLEAVALEAPRRGRIGYNALSPTQSLQEIGTTTRATQDMLRDIPIEQRGSFLASTQANALAQEAKSISDVNRINMENATRADLFNIQQEVAEGLGRGQANARYSELMGRATAGREANMHRAFNRASDIHAQNFYRDVDLNRYAAMTDNYEFDMYGARPRYLKSSNQDIQDYQKYIALKKAKGEDVNEESDKKKAKSV